MKETEVGKRKRGARRQEKSQAEERKRREKMK